MRRSEQVLCDVSDLHNIPLPVILGRVRTDRVVRARVEVARRLEALSFNSVQIGKVLGKHHTTISYYLGHGCRKYIGKPDNRPRRGKPPVKWTLLKPYAGAAAHQRNRPYQRTR